MMETLPTINSFFPSLRSILSKRSLHSPQPLEAVKTQPSHSPQPLEAVKTQPSHSPQPFRLGPAVPRQPATISMVFELILTKGSPHHLDSFLWTHLIWKNSEPRTNTQHASGRAEEFCLLSGMVWNGAREKPLKWLPVIVGASSPQPEGWGE
jgi:hypothetical protein